jgi:hypothetical protein
MTEITNMPDALARFSQVVLERGKAFRAYVLTVENVEIFVAGQDNVTTEDVTDLILGELNMLLTGLVKGAEGDKERVRRLVLDLIRQIKI